MNIYELQEQYRKLQSLIECGEFTDEELADTIEMVSDDIEIKAENYGLVMKNIEALINGIQAEEKRLAEYRKTLQNGIDKMDGNLSELLLLANKEKFKTNHFNFSFRKSESVEIVEIGSIPKEYIRVKVDEAPDKTAIKQAIKSGVDVSGARIVEKKSLQIK